MSDITFDHLPLTWKPKIIPSHKPFYIALAEQLEADIKNGNLLPGTKLPPQRELAYVLDVNVSTISRAFKLCTQKGLLCGTIGSGTVVSYDSLTNLSLIPKQTSFPLIEMGSMIPDENTYDEITQVIKEMLKEAEFGRLFGYGTFMATHWQKEAAVKFLAHMGCHSTVDTILPSQGGQNAIVAILAGLFKSGDRIGTDPLTYPGLKSAANMLGIQLVPIRHIEHEMSEESLILACENEKIKGIYTMPEYQNPTTHLMSEACKKMIARVAKQRDIIIIEDGIHSLLNETPRSTIASYAPEQTFYIASLSKIVAPGLRLAYIVTPSRYKNALTNAIYNLNITHSPFLLELASRMMASGKALKLVQDRRILAKECNHIVNKILGDFDVRGATSSSFRWLVLPEGIDANKIEEEAFNLGVQVYSSARFAVGTTKPISAIRLAITASRSLENLEKGLVILRDLLQKA
ncbi:PLP-dependent aminotransferase family protein [Sulfurospirillum arsenophilum]|uniref:aminotransferase-like domain-containing protein n=1 Tax=Sulfurospirillum arsenophilum TaxID=56698 RepID=UPI0005AAE393|nr:PLP-dependent aminotransferase family protein [Sulfurospirillum arsenophilum]